MRKLLLLTALSAAIAAPAAPVLAQSTPYYVLDGDGQTGFIIQGGTLQSTFALPRVGNFPLYAPRFDASGSTFVVANRNGAFAMEFNAGGTPTGTTYANPGQSVDQLLDGGTDGVFTYAVRCCSTANGVYRGDMQFGGLTRISALGETGVTFANSIGHIFALNGGTLYEMAVDGTLLNTFGLDASGLASLAYEASTNSLWAARNSSSTIYNYSLTGQRLASFDVAGLRGNFYGGEMANAAVTTTPEPATLGLFASGLLGIAGVARRRRTGALGD